MEKLFSEFPNISTEKWIETIRKDLKGKDIEKLLRKTIDGLEFQPFYRKENTENLSVTDVNIAEFPFLRGTKNNHDWKIRQDFRFSNKKKIAEKIKKAKEKNVDIIGLDFGKKAKISDNDLKELLLNVENVAISAFKDVEGFYDVLKKSNLKSSFINFDPITYIAFVGKHYKNDDEIWQTVEKFLQNPDENIKTIGINVKHYANAGASPVMQIAFALAIAEDYFNFATEKNISIEKILSNIHFNFSVGTEYFMEIAKLRAFRYLFAKFVESYDSKYKDSAKAYVHLTTSRRNKTIYDPYINMLRTTIEGLAGVVAGVDSLNIEAFDTVFSEPDSFSERIAVNQQIILKEEAYLDKVVDPAGGSYYVENLTVELISKAWQLFLDIQEKGGFCDALKSNYISSMISDLNKKEDEFVNNGKISVLGVNKHPNSDEKLEDKIINKPVEFADFANEKAEFEILKEYRLAENFEKIRRDVEKLESVPKVFLFTYGNAVMRRARADFAGNFFAVAGFEIEDNIGFDTLEEGIRATKGFVADIVVLCSSDDDYLEMSKVISKELKGLRIVVAGNPDSKKEIEKYGISDFIHTKSNIYEELMKY
ncbi:MAG: methylmalonyl-CoA mutase family protein [Bacteroidota bacterium]|nr:methylmalonyl-CoA mutase family protein [Bacteroidota bacterium]